MSTGYVIPTADCLPDDLNEVGGKAVGLGRLIRAHQRVPRSFVVTSRAYADYIGGLDPDMTSTMPDSLRAEIASAYAVLSENRRHADPTVAVRSSATIEDSTESSCAGQFRTFLGASGAADVVAEVERCFMSAFEPHVEEYRSQRELAGTDGVAVIVQELVDARVSGVMFTRHPRTGDRSLVVVESSYGLGEAVVGGEVTPDLFEVNKITGHVHQRMLGSKLTEHRLAQDRRSVELRDVDDDRRQSWSIGEGELASLVEVARQLESALGKGLDIEWAIGSIAASEAPEELYVLQVRPITVDPKRSTAEVHPATGTRVHNPIDQVLGRLAGRHQRQPS